MADSKISELPEVTPLAGTEEVPVNDAGTTRKTTTAAIAALGGGGGSDPLTLVNYLSFGLVVQATTTLTLDAQPEVGDTLEIDGPDDSETYTFVAPGDADEPLEISAGTDVATAVAAILAAIAGTDGHNTASVVATATSPSAGVVVFTALAAGGRGNQYAGYTNSGAGTNELPELSGGSNPPAAGAIRLPADYFVTADDGGSGYGEDGVITLVGYDLDGAYICIGGEGGGAPITIIAGGLELREPETDNWKRLEASEFVMRRPGSGESMRFQLIDDGSGFIVGGTFESGYPWQFGQNLGVDTPGGAILPNNTAMQLRNQLGVLRDFFKLTAANVLDIDVTGLPTANPGPNKLWNDGGTVKVGT